MKKIIYNTLFVFASISLLWLSSCDDNDGGGSEPEFAIPAITITSPELPAEGLNTQVGETTLITIALKAEAGLSTLKEGENIIKTFMGTETDEEVVYEFLPLEVGNQTISFAVEDALGKSATVEILMVVAEGVDLGYLLIDFSGALTSTEDKIVVDWDARKLFTFGVSGSHGTSATAEVVNLQTQITFTQDNPLPEDNAKVMKIVKVVPEGSDNWGGWAHIIFNLGSVISEEYIAALPKWDVESSTTMPGTKVILIDAYYDATVNDTLDWNYLTSLTDVWNSDPSKGYKLDLEIASYDPMGIVENGHDGAFYMGYSAYIPEPNKWVTVAFEMIDEGRTGSMFGVSADAPGPDAIDCIKIMPSPGYVGTDTNPLYFKNLRIVDVE